MSSQRHKHGWGAWILAACMAVVVAWEFMAVRSRRPGTPFTLTAAAFSREDLSVPGLTVRQLPVYPDPLAPNILVLHVQPEGRQDPPVLVRLVHGYNLVDCMRMKSFKVELLADERLLEDVSDDVPGASAAPYPLQVWRITSASGDAMIWISSMLRASDFTASPLDTRSIPFPLLGAPDRPDGQERLSWQGLLRQPIRELRAYMTAKWNRSGRDWLTFLSLKPSPLPSEQYLTFVALQPVPAGGTAEASVETTLRDVHRKVYWRLRAWRQSHRLESDPEMPPARNRNGEGV